MTTMFISLTSSRTKGFKKWSDNHPPSNDDEAAPIALAGLPLNNDDAPQKLPHRPWIIPGVGGRFLTTTQDLNVEC
jgi:hypothetical protein